MSARTHTNAVRTLVHERLLGDSDAMLHQLEQIRSLPERVLPDLGPADPMRDFTAWRERTVSPSRKS